MNSVGALKKEVEQIKTRVNPERENCAWANEDGSFGCDGQVFQNEKEFEEYVKRVGYTKMFIVSWKGEKP
jgi:hypothetical protein